MTRITNFTLPITPATAPAIAPPNVAPQEATGSSFKSMLVDSIQQVNSMFTGGDANPAEVLTAVQKADLAFRTMMQVRNKLVQAYQEVKDIRI
jgi:flagellar hook-basal body complex protein FliE